jgi:hypothetical protein
MSKLSDLAVAASLSTGGNVLPVGRPKLSMDLVRPKADPNFKEKPVGKYVKPKRFKKKGGRK